jgi:cobalamin biosynthesis protein CbiD
VPLTENAKLAYKFGSEKAQQLNENMHITDKLNTLKETVTEKVKDLNETYHVSEKAEQISQYEVVKAASDILSRGWGYIKSSFYEVQYQTEIKIAQQKGEPLPEESIPNEVVENQM